MSSWLFNIVTDGVSRCSRDGGRESSDIVLNEERLGQVEQFIYLGVTLMQRDSWRQR